MRDQNQGGAQFFVQFEHQLHDVLAGGKVQAAGGLVCQQNGRFDHKGTGQRHALLLAAGKHTRVMTQPLA